MSEMYAVTMTLFVDGPVEGRSESFSDVVTAYSKIEAADPSLLDVAFGYSEGNDSAQVDIELTVSANNDDEAYALASASVRAAIHEAGGDTPEWGRRPREATAVYRDGGPSSVELITT